MARFRRFCAGDIGSNAIKVRVVEVADGLLKTLTEDRYPIRLGASSFDKGRLSPDDIEATVSAFQEISAICRSFAVDEARVVATSAVREASNKDDLIEAVESRAGFHIEVISGLEEARLLAVALRPELVPGHHNLIIDIGGGSTELIYTRQDLELDTMHSIRLGAVRLQQAVKPGAPISRKEFALLEVTVQNMLENSHLPVIARRTHAIGVAGTLRAILDINQGKQSKGDAAFSLRDVQKMLRSLREMTFEEMQERHGIDRKRAQIIIPGVMIAAGIMELYELPRIAVSTRGLRDGILAEMITRADSGPMSSADEFAIKIGEKYNFDRSHGEQVARLALSLYDKLEPLHKLAPACRVWLHHAALLHDIGQFVTYSKHHKHSLYLIANEEFPGLSETEQQAIAVIARYHRKSPPTDKHTEFMSLQPTTRDAVEKCSAILRIADALDREHRGLVTGVDVAFNDGTITLEVHAKGPVFLELSAAGKKGQMFEKVFGCKLAVTTAAANPAREAAAAG